MNNLRGVYTIWYRDILRFWRDKMRMAGSMTLPLLFLFVFCTGLGSRLGSVTEGVDFGQFIFPGIIGMTVFMSSLAGGMSMVWDREFGFLKEVLVAPISRASVAVGKTLGAATVALLQGTIILLLGPVIGVSVTVWTALALLPLMALLSVCMGSLGVLLATRITSIEAFEAVMQMLMLPMMFLSGVFFPVQGLPSWMNVLVKINPVTYGIAPIRQVMLGTSPDSPYTINVLGHSMSVWDNVAVLGLFGVAMILLAMWSLSNQE